LGREVLDEAFKAIAVGVTTDEIDRIVHEACVDRECYPSPLNYYQASLKKFRTINFNTSIAVRQNTMVYGLKEVHCLCIVCFGLFPRVNKDGMNDQSLAP
jgi:methionine aminopeptidase